MDLTRRDLLLLGGAAAAGSTLGPVLDAACDLLGLGGQGVDPALAASGPAAGEGIDRELASRLAHALPLDRLNVVGIASSKTVRGYGRAPTRYGRYDDDDWHLTAAGMLFKAIANLSDDGDPITYLRTLVPPSGRVLIKPNWVEYSHWYRAKITHPTLVWAMAAMAAEAVGPEGRILVGEATADWRSWRSIVKATGSDRAAAALRANGLPVYLIDLNSRRYGWTKVNLGGYSRFAKSGSLFYDGHSKPMGRMGQGRVGRYLVSSQVLRADLVIDFAKAKVHCSAGVTLSLKNLLGIVPSNDGPYGDWRTKDVPHYSATERRRGVNGIFRYNGTLGYSMADLHAVARYTAKDCSLERTPQRNLLCVIDGLFSGEHSQFHPRVKRTGWVAVGRDPVALDHVATRCMGFDPTRVRSLGPSRSGRLYLGTADPRKVIVDYTGPGSFQGYFSPVRALDAEQVRAPWRDIIDLSRFSVGRIEVLRPSADTVEVRTSRHVAAVRLEFEVSGVRYAHALAPIAAGLWRGDVPPGTRMRVVAVDRHFNIGVRAL